MATCMKTSSFCWKVTDFAWKRAVSGLNVLDLKAPNAAKCDFGYEKLGVHVFQADHPSDGCPSFPSLGHGPEAHGLFERDLIVFISSYRSLLSSYKLFLLNIVL